jgi:hypothetical protein
VQHAQQRVLSSMLVYLPGGTVCWRTSHIACGLRRDTCLPACLSSRWLGSSKHCPLNRTAGTFAGALTPSVCACAGCA